MSTIKDVAERAGVAVETVSRVLNNRGYLSEKTKQKVYAAMEELNYKPNEFARGLSKKDMGMIAVIVPHIVHPYFAKAISCAEREIRRRGCKMYLYNSSGDEEREKHTLELCQNSFITGVLLFSSDIRPDFLRQFQIPIVTIERDVENATTCILCDNALGGRLAAKELIRCGCRNLAAFGDIQDSAMPGDDRLVGFSEACAAAAVPCRTFRSNNDQYMTMQYEDRLSQLIDQNADIDGLFLTSDLIAAQAIQVCSKRGIRIPRDLQMVGFDDVDLAQYVYPRLTTLRQPVEEMVKEAVDCIFRAVRNERVPHRKTFPVTLIRRDTTYPFRYNRAQQVTTYEALRASV